MSEKSTTPDLLERTRRVYEIANLGDFGAIAGLFAPDAVWEQPDGMETFAGAAAIRRFVEEWQGSYEEYEVEVEEILGLGSGVTFAVSVQTGRPLDSAGHVRIRFAAVYVWAEGSIVRMMSYGDVDEARAAAKRLAESRG